MATAEIAKLENKLDQIVTLLKGNPLDPTDHGLVGECNEMNGRLKKLEKLRDKIMWVVFGMALPTGYGITKILGAIADSIFSK